MSLPRGARTGTCDGRRYRWYVRPTPTTAQRAFRFRYPLIRDRA